MQHLLDLLALVGQHILDDRHEQRWLGAAVESCDDDSAQGLKLYIVAAALEMLTELLRRQVDALVRCDDRVCDCVWGGHGCCSSLRYAPALGRTTATFGTRTKPGRASGAEVDDALRKREDGDERGKVQG